MRFEQKAALWVPVLLSLSLPFAGLKLLQAPASAQAASDPPLEHAEAPISPLFTPEVQRWASQILGWSQEFGLPADLIATVMQIESCGHPTVSSSAGAMGLFQVMPFHFAWNEDPFDPPTNARRGLAYLRRAVQLAQGDPALALAGYNGGHSLMDVPPDGWPAETQRYVMWGAGLWEDVSAGASASQTLERWLDAGGRSLCQRAAQTPAY